MVRKERTTLEHELFDHRYPLVSTIREKYKEAVDLTRYENLSRENIADAVLTLKGNQYLILPEINYFSTYVDKKRGLVIKINTPQKFRKFGEQIDIVKSDITIREIKEQKLTLRKAFKNLDNPENREKLKNGSYRGIGWWSPRSRRHNILWFDVPVEGQKYLDFFRNEFKTEYLYADAYQEIPSFSRLDRSYITQLNVLPVTEKNNEYCVESLETFAKCSCEDAFYMGIKSHLRDETEAIYKYINPEQIICKHNWAQRILAEELSQKNEKAKKILTKIPKATGLINPWFVLKTRTIVLEEGGARRPLKTEIGILCGNIIGYLGASNTFDLEE